MLLRAEFMPEVLADCYGNAVSGADGSFEFHVMQRRWGAAGYAAAVHCDRVAMCWYSSFWLQVLGAWRMVCVVAAVLTRTACKNHGHASPAMRIIRL